MREAYTEKKRLAIFQSLAGMSLTNECLIIPGDGKIANLFFTVYGKKLYITFLKRSQGEKFAILTNL